MTFERSKDRNWPIWFSLTLAILVFCNLGLIPEALTAATTAPEPVAAVKQSKPAQQPSPRLINLLRQDLSRRVGVPAGKLRVLASTAKTWPDSCLGLAGADEVCGAALVDGWRVVFTNGKQRWVYRTDRQGRTYRLEAIKK